MLRPRLIAALLVDAQLHLLKTIAFEQRHYLGDPLNAAYVFSGYEVDELLVLDIDASPQGRPIPARFVEALARFTRVPLTIGGGITTLEQIHDLLALGVEKVALSAALTQNLTFLQQAVVKRSPWPGSAAPLQARQASPCWSSPWPVNRPVPASWC